MNTTISTLKNAMWIGWQMESNWTKTWIYFIYAALRPLALCLILFYLYKSVTANPAGEPHFVSLYVGNAFFSIFIAVAGGISWVVIQDREHYRIIRYIYMAPAPFWLYIVGRALVVLLISLVSLVMIIAFGALVLKLPIGFAHQRLLLLLPSTVLGVATAAAVGLMFAGLCLITARHSMLMAEGAGAVFLLACGVLYPIDFLPPVARVVGYVLPMTYWMEAVRRSFGGYGFSRSLAGLSDLHIMLLLAALTLVFCAMAGKVFALCERSAKRSGKLDQTTNY